VDSVHDLGRSAALGELGRFRWELYTSLTARGDALFELTDAEADVELGPQLLEAQPNRYTP
jgi:hypothetical protein